MPRTTARPGRLPAEATSFVGRRHEVAEARRKLAVARLVSLVGPGGVGKTRLAIRIAADLGRGFPDGAWLVELAELRDPALVGNAVLAALDLRDQAATEPPARLRAHLADKQLLLVLDNCEHLLDAVARLIGEIMAAAPRVRVLATSREPLGVAGEHVLPVPPLELPSPHAAEPLARLRHNEAVALFVERAAAASGGFELTAANRTAVVGLCRQLDGPPLAIELAAVRTRALAPEQIRDRLSDRFALLTGGSRTALPRQQTLHTTITWSYDLLTPAERTLLARLCVFAGRFTLADVEHVCCYGLVAAAHALDLVSSLIGKSLVVKENLDDGACYRLHETIRDYARLKLHEIGEEVTAERRCTEYYVSQCAQFAMQGRHRLLPWLAWTELEIDNIRAVLRWHLAHEDPRGAALASSLIWYWITRATTEGTYWLDELLTFDTDAAAGPWPYFVRGFLAVLQSNPTDARPALERAISAARTTGQQGTLSQVLAMASIAANAAGDRATAGRLLDQARAIADGLDDLGSTLMVLQARALNGIADSDLEAVRTAADAGARLARKAGDLYSLGMMLLNQGFAALVSGDIHEAGDRLAEGLRIARLLDDRVAQCHLIGALACCAERAHEPRLAARLFGAVQTLRAEAGAEFNAGMSPTLAQATASAVATLGTARFEAEFTVGRQLSRDAAARLALGEAVPPSSTGPEYEGAGVLRRREVDVARLLAEGLSNKEIGARLFISERTVESHVRNILNRLGFNSRAQIAGWMRSSEG